MGSAMDSVPGQLDEIKLRLDKGELRRAELVRSIDAVNARLDAGDRRMHAIEFAVAENTVITKEMADATRDIRDAVVAGRVANRVVRWLGGLAAALSAMYLLWTQVVPPAPSPPVPPSGAPNQRNNPGDKQP